MLPEEVEKVAHLARLAISSPEELATYTRNLTDILDLIAQLTTIDTTGVEPMYHPLDATQPLRIDNVTETDEQAKLKKVAPFETVAGLYLVPQVLE